MTNNKTQIFEQHRKTLEGLAYQMLGTLSEAQDAVQESYLKWHHQDIAQTNNVRAWLITVCSRICLNQLKRSYKQREVYIGEWLPEPLFDDTQRDASHDAALNDSLNIALLHVLEKLSPTERAVFLLHDVFEINFNEIAGIVDKTAPNCRQIAKRARERVKHNRPRFTTSQTEHQTLLRQFVKAVQACNVDELTAILTPDTALYSDGGGKVEALPNVLQGSQKIAAFFTTIFTNFKKQNIRIQIVEQVFNHSLGVLIYENGLLATALTIACHQQAIQTIYAVRNPEKLLHSPTLTTD